MFCACLLLCSVYGNKFHFFAAWTETFILSNKKHNSDKKQDWLTSVSVSFFTIWRGLQSCAFTIIPTSRSVHGVQYDRSTKLQLSSIQLCFVNTLRRKQNISAESPRDLRIATYRRWLGLLRVLEYSNSEYRNIIFSTTVLVKFYLRLQIFISSCKLTNTFRNKLDKLCANENVKFNCRSDLTVSGCYRLEKINLVVLF